MPVNANIRFEDWEAERMKDPKFRAAVEELEPKYQAARASIAEELFPDIAPGEAVEVNWRKEDLRFACCECGLVHRIRFVVCGHRLRLRAYQDGEGTKIMRELLRAGKEGRSCALEHDGDPIKDFHHVLPKNLTTEDWQGIISGTYD